MASNLISLLAQDYLQQKRRGENIDRAAALLGLAGTNPTQAEVSMVAERGGVDPGYGVVGPADDQGHYTISAGKELRRLELADAMKRNAEASDMLRAAGWAAGAGADLEDGYKAMGRRGKLEAIQALRAQLTPEQQIAAYSDNPDISPVRMAGGVAYNRYDPNAPIVGESSAVQATAGLRNAQAATQPSITAKNQAAAGASEAIARLRGVQADDAELRRAALDEVMQQTSSGPVLADIANKRPVSRPQRIKVVGQDGNSYYLDAAPNLKGGYDYTPATSDGTLLQAPAAAGQRPTALASNLQTIMHAFPGMSEQDALVYEKSDPQTRARIVREWQKRPRSQAAAPAPAAPSQPAPPVDANLAYTQARQRIKAGYPPDKVAAKLRQLGLDPSKL